jgi:SAM-dependent methyltransferase
MATNVEKYLQQVKIESLFEKFGASDPKTLANTVEHFTTKEAEKRDKILIDYFGQSGVNRIVNSITKLLLKSSMLPANAKVLDIGAGSGLFTAKIAEKIHNKLPEASFYAMDLTPALLLSLAKKKTDITPFVGVAENIKDSITEARKYLKIPQRFDAVFSTLMLHHSTQPEKVFKSLKTVLKKSGKAIVVDLCEHGFKEFKTEMGDVHLGFKPKNVHGMARKYFPKVEVEKIPGICCESSGRSAEIFIAFMQN